MVKYVCLRQSNRQKSLSSSLTPLKAIQWTSVGFKCVRLGNGMEF